MQLPLFYPSGTPLLSQGREMQLQLFNLSGTSPLVITSSDAIPTILPLVSLVVVLPLVEVADGDLFGGHLPPLGGVPMAVTSPSYGDSQNGSTSAPESSGSNSMLPRAS